MRAGTYVIERLGMVAEKIPLDAASEQARSGGSVEPQVEYTQDGIRFSYEDGRMRLFPWAAITEIRFNPPDA